MALKLRPATPADAEFVFRLRTDPETVAQSFGPPPETIETHRQWMNTQNDLYIAEWAGRRIGIGRIDLQDTIGITIAPEWRGHRLAVLILRALEEQARAHGRPRLIARVKPQNIRSWRAFLSAGYQMETTEICLQKILT